MDVIYIVSLITVLPHSVLELMLASTELFIHGEIETECQFDIIIEEKKLNLTTYGTYAEVLGSFKLSADCRHRLQRLVNWYWVLIGLGSITIVATNC